MRDGEAGLVDPDPEQRVGRDAALDAAGSPANANGPARRRAPAAASTVGPRACAARRGRRRGHPHPARRPTVRSGCPDARESVAVIASAPASAGLIDALAAVLAGQSEEHRRQRADLELESAHRHARAGPGPGRTSRAARRARSRSAGHPARSRPSRAMPSGRSRARVRRRWCASGTWRPERRRAAAAAVPSQTTRPRRRTV